MTKDEIKNVIGGNENMDKKEYKKLIKETVNKIENISALKSINTVVTTFYKNQIK